MGPTYITPRIWTVVWAMAMLVLSTAGLKAAAQQPTATALVAGLPDDPSYAPSYAPSFGSGVGSGAHMATAVLGLRLDATPAEMTETAFSGSSGFDDAVAPVHMKYIPAEWQAQRLTKRDKFFLGVQDVYDPLTLSGEVGAAGWEQLRDGAPNFGTNRGAFVRRLGAAAVRETTEGLLTDSVFAPLLREDPRYYVQGPQYNPIRRAIYAITRPLMTINDNGHQTVNAALLLGYGTSSALTYAYYPQINRNFRDVASVFGGSLGGAALGFFVSEFSSDVLQLLHLEGRQ